MKSDDDYFNYLKSIFNNNLKTPTNLSSNINIKYNNIQQAPYLIGNSSENKNEKISMIKNELECEKDKNIENFLTKDIINSINEINFEPNNTSIKEISIKNNTESYEKNKNSSWQKNCEDNINNKKLKIEKEIKDEFSLNFGGNKSSDIHMNNKNKINYLNLNVSTNKIYSVDNQKDQRSNNENNKLTDNNIHVNIEENNPIIKNKEICNLDEIAQKNNAFELNIGDIKMNNKEFLGKEDSFNSFNKNSFEPKFNIFQNQNNLIKLNFLITE